MACGEGGDFRSISTKRSNDTNFVVTMNAFSRHRRTAAYRNYSMRAGLSQPAVSIPSHKKSFDVSICKRQTTYVRTYVRWNELNLF